MGDPKMRRFFRKYIYRDNQWMDGVHNFVIAKFGDHMSRIDEPFSSTQFEFFNRLN